MPNLELVFLELGTVGLLLGIYALANRYLASDERINRNKEYSITDDPNEGNKPEKIPLTDEKHPMNPLYKTSFGGKKKTRRN